MTAAFGFAVLVLTDEDVCLPARKPAGFRASSTASNARTGAVKSLSSGPARAWRS